MPAPKKGKRFGKSAAHQKPDAREPRRAPHRGRGAITTTETKAKALRPYVEKLVTKAKDGGVHKQRQVVATHPRQGRHAQALRRHRAPLHRPQRRLHADPQARPPPGRQRPHGAHRVRLDLRAICADAFRTELDRGATAIGGDDRAGDVAGAR